MARSYVSATGTGSPQDVNLTFSYINQSHVFVYAGTTPLSYVWVGPSTVRFTAPAGSSVRVARQTPNDSLVQFSQPNLVGSTDLNLVATQAMFVAQEVADSFDLLQDSTFVVSVAGRQGEVTLTPTDIEGFTTAVRNETANAFTPGSNISIAPNGLGGYTISATGTISTDWANVSGKPASFPTTWTDVQSKPTSFPSSWDQISGKPSLYPSNPTISEVSGLPTELSNKMDKGGVAHSGSNNISFLTNLGYIALGKNGGNLSYFNWSDGNTYLRAENKVLIGDWEGNGVVIGRGGVAVDFYGDVRLNGTSIQNQLDSKWPLSAVFLTNAAAVSYNSKNYIRFTRSNGTTFDVFVSVVSSGGSGGGSGGEA